MTTLIIPGLDGSREGHWQQWWLDNDPTSQPVHLSELHHPVPEEWEQELLSAIMDNPGATLVGHSLGAVLVARVLTRWPYLDVKAALLVAPAEDPGHPRAKPFTPLPELALQVPTTLVASQNDPWMSQTRARKLASLWRSRFVDVGMAGHVNIESGFGPWPLGFALRDELHDRAASSPRYRQASPAGHPLLHTQG